MAINQKGAKAVITHTCYIIIIEKFSFCKYGGYFIIYLIIQWYKQHSFWQLTLTPSNSSRNSVLRRRLASCSPSRLSHSRESISSKIPNYFNFLENNYHFRSLINGKCHLHTLGSSHISGVILYLCVACELLLKVIYIQNTSASIDIQKVQCLIINNVLLIFIHYT